MLKENGAYDAVSIDLNEGLGLVQNKSRSQKLEKVSNTEEDLMMNIITLRLIVLILILHRYF